MAARSQQSPDPSADLARRLALSYSALLRGLPYRGSESSDSSFRPFHLAAPQARFDLDRFREVTGLLPAWQLSTESGVTFLERLAGWEHDGWNDDEPSAAAAAAAYRTLADVMRAASTGDLHHVTAAPGASMRYAWHPTRHYVFGEVSGGLAGLVAFSTET